MRQKENSTPIRVLGMAALLMLAALAAALVLWQLEGRRTYTLRLPSPEDIAELVVTQGESEARLSGKEEIDAVTGLLLADGRTSTLESIQDMPVNVENCIQIDYRFAGGGVSTLFAYEKQNGYWLEQPYNGIYALTREEFEALAAPSGLNQLQISQQP